MENAVQKLIICRDADIGNGIAADQESFIFSLTQNLLQRFLQGKRAKMYRVFTCSELCQLKQAVDQSLQISFFGIDGLQVALSRCLVPGDALQKSSV